MTTWMASTIIVSIALFMLSILLLKLYNRIMDNLEDEDSI